MPDDNPKEKIEHFDLYVKPNAPLRIEYRIKHGNRLKEETVIVHEERAVVKRIEKYGHLMDDGFSWFPRTVEKKAQGTISHPTYIEELKKLPDYVQSLLQEIIVPL